MVTALVFISFIIPHSKLLFFDIVSDSFIQLTVYKKVPYAGYMSKLLKLLSAIIFVLVFLVLSSRQSVQAADPAGWGKATVWWNGYDGAVKYRIYYKEAREKTWTHAARGLMEPARSFTIEFLKSGVTYNYQVVAVKNDDTEVWFTPVRSFWAGSKVSSSNNQVWKQPQASVPSMPAAPTQPSNNVSSATASWTWQTDADTYNVYYREAGQKGYTHAVPGVPSNGTSVKIMSLKPGVVYYYNVAVVDNGMEVRWLGEKALTWAWKPQVVMLNKKMVQPAPQMIAPDASGAMMPKTPSSPSGMNTGPKGY